MVKRVLVTGGTGLLGRHAVASLLRQGCEVHVLTRRELETGGNGAVYRRCDLLDGERVRTLLWEIRPEVLLHLAWDVKQENYLESPRNLWWAEAGMNLLQAFAKAGGEGAFLAGSCLEYAEADAPLRESDRLAPLSRYAQCKHRLHLRAAELAEQEGTRLLWGRFFYLFGEGEQPARAVPYAVRGLLAGERVVCKNSDAVRDYLCASDAAELAVRLLLKGAEGTVNIASGTGVRMGELFRAIERLTGRAGLVEYHSETAAPSMRVAEISRLRELVPGWEPPPLEKRLAEGIV